MPGSRVELRRLDPVRRVLRSWREMTGGTGRLDLRRRRTLVACSAGVDSSALAFALASATSEIVLGHVVHDLRGRVAREGDRDAARDLAARLGVEFAHADVTIERRGNLEAGARRARYTALAGMAEASGCEFVATGHQADDQLETVLMQLLRGRRSLAGAAPTRRLTRGVRLIRPMLVVTRAEAEAICRSARWAWREDATNEDESRLRAALRGRVLPILRELSPTVAGRAVRIARVQREMDEALEVWAASVPCVRTEGEIEWRRGDVAGLPPAVRAELLRSGLAGVGARAAAGRELDAMARAMGERAPKRYGIAGACVLIDGEGTRILASGRSV